MKDLRTGRTLPRTSLGGAVNGNFEVVSNTSSDESVVGLPRSTGGVSVGAIQIAAVARHVVTASQLDSRAPARLECASAVHLIARPSLGLN